MLFWCDQWLLWWSTLRLGKKTTTKNKKTAKISPKIVNPRLQRSSWERGSRSNVPLTLLQLLRRKPLPPCSYPSLSLSVSLSIYLSVCLSLSVCLCVSHSVSVSDCLVGLVVRRPPRERKVPASNPACPGIFSGSSHTGDLKIGTPVATLPGAWRYRVSTGTGQPGVSIL